MESGLAQYGPVHRKKITATMMDYLTVIFDLERNKQAVRVKDIAGTLGVKMPSVSSMLKKLANHGLVKYRKREYVELKDRGIRFALEVHRRREILRLFLTDVLTVEHETAVQEANQMVHWLSPETLGRLTAFMDFIEFCPKALERWPVRFKAYRENGRRLESAGIVNYFEEFKASPTKRLGQRFFLG